MSVSGCKQTPRASHEQFLLVLHKGLTDFVPSDSNKIFLLLHIRINIAHFGLSIG